MRSVSDHDEMVRSRLRLEEQRASIPAAKCMVADKSMPENMYPGYTFLVSAHGYKRRHTCKTVAAICETLGRGFKFAVLCLVESRPVVQAMFLLRFITGASFAGTLLAPGLWLGAAVWGCVTLAVYVLNGAMDLEEDEANRSDRPIASGRLTAERAVWVAVGLGLSGVLGSVALGLHRVAVAAAVALALGILYSAPPLRLKRWPSGLAVTATLGVLLTYYAGHAANGGVGGGSEAVAFAVVMALWVGLVGQTKDFSDVEGDRRAGRKSLPVVRGERTAGLFVAGAALGIAAAFAAFAFISASGELLWPAGILAVGAAAVALVTLGPWSKGSRRKRRRPYRVFMGTQYGVHLAVILL